MACAAAGLTGYSLGKDAVTAELYRVEEVYKQKLEESDRATANALAQLEKEQDVYNQLLQKELQSKTIYRDCRSGADAVRLFNSAKKPTAPARPKPASSSVVP